MSDFDAYATGCSFCKGPIPFELASTDILVGSLGLKYFSIGVVAISFLMCWMLVCWCSVQCHWVYNLEWCRHLGEIMNKLCEVGCHAEESL